MESTTEVTCTAPRVATRKPRSISKRSAAPEPSPARPSTAEPGSGVCGAALTRSSFYQIVSGPRNRYDDDYSYEYRWYVSQVRKFDSQGVEDTAFQGPYLNSPGVDAGSTDPWWQGQVINDYSYFQSLAIDESSGIFYLLRADIHLEPDGYHAAAHDIVEFAPSGQGSYAEVGSLPVGQMGFINDYSPVSFAAANGELAIAGVREFGTTGTGVKVAVTRGVNVHWRSTPWDLAQSPNGTPPISTTPLGLRAFDVRSVAVNSHGDVYVAGASLGDFEGRSLVQDVWVGGWLTRFSAPLPPA